MKERAHWLPLLLLSGVAPHVAQPPREPPPRLGRGAADPTSLWCHGARGRTLPRNPAAAGSKRAVGGDTKAMAASGEARCVWLVLLLLWPAHHLQEGVGSAKKGGGYDVRFVDSCGGPAQHHHSGVAVPALASARANTTGHGLHHTSQAVPRQQQHRRRLVAARDAAQMATPRRTQRQRQHLVRRRHRQTTHVSSCCHEHVSRAGSRRQRCLQ